jgi:hypothetical protein
VVVVGENDRKGAQWPGDPAPFARALQEALGRPVKTVLPSAPWQRSARLVARGF